MTKRGTITLINSRGEVIVEKQYGYPAGRRETIREWKHLYGMAFSGCAIQIAPETNYHMVNPDGTNKKRNQTQKL